jgi:hypothetical protein
MGAATSSLRLVYFAAFEFDRHARELRKHGLQIKLSGQPMEVLAITQRLMRACDACSFTARVVCGLEQRREVVSLLFCPLQDLLVESPIHPGLTA